VKTVQLLIYPYISNIAIALCFVPLLLLLWKRMSREKAYLFVAIYWLANGLMNLPYWLGQASNNKLQTEVVLLYNLLDAPLALLVFYFSSTGIKKKILLYLLISFILFELVILFWKGNNFTSSTIIIGGSTLIALTFSLAGITQYFNKIEHSYFDNTMGFVYAGFLFNYGPFIVIYIFSYLQIVSNDTIREANLFLYFLSLFSATFLTSIGLWRYAKPNFKERFEY
jgi:hypothetical protein